MSYPVGTICVGQNLVSHPERNGVECAIIKPLQWVETINLRKGREGWDYRYQVRWADGLVSWQLHSQLKRKSDYDEDKRAEDRKKVKDFLEPCQIAVQK